ncbi:MAG: integrase family protein [Candidatus Competibacteraceae bacterium]|nr:integrase family protein [Candidatus Competibacteraceae bacterium]
MTCREVAMKLSKRTIEAIKSPAEGSAFYWDDDLPGFGLRVWASGTKTFIVQRRINGRDKRITIGRFGSKTAEQAKREAKTLIGNIASGRDPVAERERQKAESVTLAQACQGYLERRTLKPRTINDIHKAMLKLSDWQNRPLMAITPDMVTQRHKKLGEASPAQANLTMRYLRAIMNFAQAEYTAPDGTPILSHNPVARLSSTKGWYRVDRRQSVIRAAQLKPWMQAVMALGNQVARDYLLLVLLTGLRRSEALGLTWAGIDFDARTLTVMDTKAHRSHTLPLSDFLQELLTRRKDWAVGEYVFSDRHGRVISNLRYIQARIEQQSGVAFCIHDLRRTFATVAESLDIPAYALKRLLNHSTRADVTAGYIVVDTERLRAPMQRITDYILKAGGLRDSAPVVELNPQREKQLR